MDKPTIGRVVIYKTTEEDRKKMRESSNQNVQHELPATIVAVWSESCVNVKVDIDGEGQLWKTSINLGTEEGNWGWPNREA
jgi:hypothetical protein